MLPSHMLGARVQKIQFSSQISPGYRVFFRRDTVRIQPRGLSLRVILLDLLERRVDLLDLFGGRGVLGKLIVSICR
jgi:hypothetical protein